MQFKSVPVSIKAGPEEGLAEGEFIVYPSTFIRRPDSYGDVVAKGAFLDDIKAWKDSGDVLPGLYGHRMDDPDFFVAGASDMGEDENGWWVRGQFDFDSPKGPQVYRLVKGRRIRQLSFAYDVLEEGSVELEDGTKANELRKLKVHEFSFVPVGANQDTSILAVKSAATVLVEGVKAGRVLSAKNEAEIKSAIADISTAATRLQELLPVDPDQEQEDEQKASGDAEAKSGASDEAPTGKSSVPDEEPKSRPSAKTFALLNTQLALSGQKGDSA